MPVDEEIQSSWVIGVYMDGGGLPQFSQEDIMTALLSESQDRDQEEPEIAANILSLIHI